MRMKKLLSFLTLLTLFFGVGWAAEVSYSLGTNSPGTWTINATGGSNNVNKSRTVTTSEGFVLTHYNPVMTNNTAVGSIAAGYIGLLGTDYFSVSHPTYTITKLELTLSQVGGDISNETGSGSYDNETNTWTGSSSEVILKGSGKQNRISSITITYTTGASVEVPVISIDPENGPYHVGSTVTASITCETTDATLSYKIDDGSWTSYTSGNIPITSETAGDVVITAKAEKDGEEATATKTVTFVAAPTSVATVAEFLALDNGTEFTFTGSLVVSAQNNNYLYAQDATGGIYFYGAAGHTYAKGDVIPANFTGKRNDYNGLPQVIEMQLAEATTHDQPLSAEVITPSDITLNPFNLFEYSVINKATVTNNSITVDGESVTTNGRLGVSAPSNPAGKKYDVYGIPGWNNNAAVYYPIEYIEHEAAYSITVNQPAEGGSISADAETADEGDEITLTATPAPGYELASWTVTDNDGAITVTDNKFTVRTSNVTVAATFSKIKYTVATNVTPANSGEVWVLEGCTVENGVSVSTAGTTVKVKLHTYNNYQVDGILVKDADENEIATTLTNTENDGLTYSFEMPASAVTVTGIFAAYAPDVYIKGNLNGGVHWEDAGLKMTYNSSSKTYSIRVYASDENGYFRFYANGGSNGSPSYGAGGVNLNPLGAVQDLWKDGDANFCVPAGIYDIVVGQVYDDPTQGNANWWGQTTVTVTKVEPTLEFSPAAGAVVSGTQVTVSSDLYELLSAINGEVAENDVTNMVKTDGDYAAIVTLDGAATVTGRAKYGNIEQTATAEYTILQENNNTQYKLIKSANDLVNGKKYLVVGTYPNDSKTFVMGAYNEPRLSGVDATPENDIIEATADMRIVTLEAVGTNWALKTDDGYVYTNSTTTNGYAAYVEAQEPAVITFESETTGELNIKFVNNDVKGYLTPQRFGNSSNYTYAFGGYASTTSVTASHLFLYRQVEEVVTLQVETPVITPGTGTYAEAKTVEITCPTPDATIWYKYGNMADYAEYTAPLTISENTTLSAYATKNGYTDSEVATATYTFSALSDDVFTLVTSETQLVPGNKYIIVAATDTYKPALGAIEDRNGTPANGYTFETAGDYSQLTLTAESDVNIFTLGKVEVTDPNDKFYWTFKDKDDNFLYANKGGGAIDTEDQSNYSNVYKISIGSGSNYNNYATIQGSADFQIEYRTDYNIFRHYASSNVNQTGNVYKKVLLYTQSVEPQLPELTLAEIETLGEQSFGKTYTIKDKLLVVHADVVRGLLWCKDDNASIFPTYKKGNQIDYLLDVVNEQEDGWDQSNWIALQFSEPTSEEDPIYIMLNDAEGNYIKAGTITGTISDASNFTLTMAKDELEFDGAPDPEFSPNVYCTANFLPENLNLTDESTGAAGIYNGENAFYFFVNPKVQEYCVITYAEWAGNNTFIAPTPSEEYPHHNDGLIDGAFTVAWKYNSTGKDNIPALEVGTAYRFEAIVSRTPNSSYLNEVTGNPSDQIVVYPANLDPANNAGQVITAIKTIEAGNGEVKSVKYVNVAGIVSDRPFEGMNIVVTEYTDGSRTTTKMIKK
jgi:hypothetical protein